MKESSENLNDTNEPVEDQSSDFVPLGRKSRITWVQMVILLLLLGLCIYELFSSKSCYTLILLLFTLRWISRKREILPAFIRNRIAPFFYPLKARFRLFRFWLIRGRVEHIQDECVHVCLSCGNSFQGNYCNCCGQSSATARYHFRNSAKTFFEGITSINNRFLRTLLELLYRPGYMISDFMRGKRIVYVSPFQGLFLLAALYVIAAQIIDPDALKPKGLKEQTAAEKSIGESGSSVDIGLQDAEISNGAIFLNATDSLDREKVLLDRENRDLSDRRDKSKSILSNAIKTNKVLSGIRDYINRTPFLQKIVQLLNRWKSGNKALDIIFLLPFFSFASFLVFRGSRNKIRYNPTEHFYIQTYIACQLLFLSILALLFKGKVAMNDWYEIPWWVIFLIFWLDYKQIFRRDWWSAFWRTLQFFIYILLLVLVLAVLVILFLLLMTKLVG